MRKTIIKIIVVILMIGMATNIFARMTKVLIRNKCYKDIWVAMHYKDVDGVWITDGWHWISDPGSPCYIPFSPTITGRIFYISAKTFDGLTSWGKGDLYLSVRGSIEKYPFTKVKFRQYRSLFIYSIVCE